jgi:hypothetical protein
MSTDAQWRRVPAQVRELYIKYAKEARDLQEANPAAAHWIIRSPEVGEIRVIKRAAAFEPLTRAFGGAQRLLGGANPLTATLAGSALGAGLGYGTGRLLGWALPRKYADPRKTARRMALMGGLAGGGLGAWGSSPTVREHGVPGLFMSGPFKDNIWEKMFPKALDDGYTPEGFKEVVKDAEATLQVEFERDEHFEKLADRTGAFLPNVPTDIWGRTVIDDPFLSAQQQAIAAGLPQAAAASRGSRWVSPADIGRIAVGAGLGGALGKGIGTLAQAFLGVSPQARDDLQSAGIFAGALKALMPGSIR